MADPAIRVENLSKRYRIGLKQSRPETLFGALREALTSPLRNYRRLRDMTRFEGTGEEEDIFWALRDISFDVGSGDALGIIGRNGAGKSTLLKILSRITAPTSGEAIIRGRASSLLEVGTGFHPDLTGHENIYLNGTILGMKKWEIDRKYDEIVDFSGVEKFLETPVKFYSSGMKVRLAFAVAAHLEPEILIIDEVLAVGDVEFQRKCLGKMKDVGKGGRTVLFVSHNMGAVEQLCNSALYLQDGKVKSIGRDVRGIIQEYLFDNNGEALSAVWSSNGNGQLDSKWLRPLRFFIADEQGDPMSMPASNDADMWVEIIVDIKELDPALNIGYVVYNEEGSILYTSTHTDGPSDAWPRLHEGVCRLRSKLPRRFFNEGNYRLEITASLHNIEWLMQPGINAPSVFLSIQGKLSDSPFWLHKRPGTLAPIMEWNVEDPIDQGILYDNGAGSLVR